MTSLEYLLDHFELVPEQNFALNHGWAPGKLFMAGEYAVLAPQQPALLFAVGQYLHVQVQMSLSLDRGSFQSNLPNLASWVYQRSRLDLEHAGDWRYVWAGLTVVESLVSELGRPLQDYQISIESQLLAANGAKYGFGSSGAVTVAVVQALLGFYGLKVRSPRVLYKLAALAMMRLDAKGSLADLAVSSHGGWLYYVAPDRSWLKQASQSQSILSLLAEDWPDLVLEPLPQPKQLEILIGWTGKPASTDDLIYQWQAGSQVGYQHFLQEAKATVEGLKQAFLAQDALGLQAQIADYRHLLLQLQKQAGFAIETPALTQLVSIAQAYQFEAKSSGAGGGDCGIAIGHGASLKAELKAAWQEASIELVDIEIGAPSQPREEGQHEPQS